MDGMNNKRDPMPTGERALGSRIAGGSDHATLRIRRCAALPAHMQERTREIHRLHVPAEKRRQGFGTTLMHKVCREADAAGLTLVLFVGAFDRQAGDMEDPQLFKWYTDTFGFVVLQAANDDHPMMLARMPDSTPRVLSLNPTVAAVQRAKAKQ